jgi:hypothetical protein
MGKNQNQANRKAEAELKLLLNQNKWVVFILDFKTNNLPLIINNAPAMEVVCKTKTMLDKPKIWNLFPIHKIKTVNKLTKFLR